MNFELVQLPLEHQRLALAAMSRAVEQTNTCEGLRPIDRVRLVVAFARHGSKGTGQRVAWVHLDLPRGAVDPLPIPSPGDVEAAVELLARVDARMFAERGRIIMPTQAEMDDIGRAAIAAVWEAVPTRLLHARREFLLCLVDGESLVVAHLESVGKFVLH